jgi:Winged helix-turn-helix domain (DUF2582)
MAVRVFGNSAGKNASGSDGAPLGVSGQIELKHEVGETAGKVWHALSSEGPLTMAELKKRVDGQGDLVSLAIGWLAREDKIEIRPEKRTLRVQLK